MHLRLQTLLFLLPFIVTCSPLDSPPATTDHISGHGIGNVEHNGSPTKILMHRRSLLIVDEDDSASIDLLRRQVADSTRKIDRGFIAYLHNTGVRHPLDTLDPRKKLKRKTGSGPLTGYHESLWYGTVQVGTPPKNYTVDFDTGSSDLFLPGPSCSPNCAGHKAYDPSQSSTSVDVRQTFQLMYGDGSSVQGEQYNDTVIIGGLIAKNQRLGAATQYGSGFSIKRFPADGLLGLGFPAISQYNADPSFQNFITQGQTTQPVFSFKLADAGSQLFLGGLDAKDYKGEITYVPVTEQGYWQVSMDSVEVNGTQVLDQLAVIVDTGTTLVIGDSTSVSQLYAAIPGSKDASSSIGEGFYTVPCNAILAIGLTFSGKTFAISPRTFNQGHISKGSPDCVGGIVSSDIGNDFWIVGDVFLRNVYAVFDVGNTQVGFAQLA